MRVTTQAAYRTLLRNVTTNLERYRRIQEELSNEQKLLRPSDDPSGIATSTSLKQTLAANMQYLANLTEAEEFLNATDAAMQDFNDILARAREIAEMGATETSDETARAIAAQQVQELIDQALEVANTQVRDRYIFSGHRTSTQAFGDVGLIMPAYNQILNTYDGDATSSGDFTGDEKMSYLVRVVSAGDLGVAQYQVSEDGGETWGNTHTLTGNIDVFDDVNGQDLGVRLGLTDGTFAEGDQFRIDVVEGRYNGDNGVIEFNAMRSSRLATNVTGQEVLDDTGFFAKLQKLRLGLEDSNTFEISEALEELKQLQNDMQVGTVKAGIRLNKVEVAKNSLVTMNENLLASIQGIEKPDLIETITALAAQEAALQSSTSALSKIFMQSLLNYI
ncbi:MAG: hypothetical protein K8R90_07570 [Candidatus Cloacimonetes bacterium]|nr:hypothetical protein [Candidatus Cloacimonadota bacterium]